jgi:hypothetical protein
VAKVKAEADGVLFVDAGDDLTGPQVLAPQRVPRARLIVDVYQALGLDALGAGEKDREVHVDEGKLRGGAMVTRAGVRVGVLSADLDAAPPPTATVLAKQAAALSRKGAKLVVALLHGGVAKAKALLESAPTGIHVAVTSHSPWGTTRPERAGGTWIVETPPQGKMVGRLDLHVLDGKLEFVDVGERAQVELDVQTSVRELAALDERYRDAEGPMKQFHQKRRGEIEREIVARKALLAADEGRQAPIRMSWLENQLVNLGTEIPDDPRIVAMVKKYKDQVAPPPASPTTTGTTATTATTGAAPPQPIPPGYTGVGACGRCHQDAVRFWEQGKHARAWPTLLSRNQQNDPACFACHVTANVTSMPNVQCEECHGPGAAHARDPKARGLTVRDPPESKCTTCHRPPQAKEWDYKTFRAAILGPGHGAPVAAK